MAGADGLPPALSSDSQVHRRIGCTLVVHGGDLPVDYLVEMLGGSESQMGEEVALKITPCVLDVIEFGGVFGQPFDGEPRAGGERRCGQLAGVDGSIIEHQHDPLGCTIGTRTCSVVSRSRMVTALSSRLSKSTVTARGVPISS